MTNVREFRPLARRSRVGLVLAIVLGTLMLVGTVVLGGIAAGSSQVTYTQRAGVLTIDSGSLMDGTRTFAGSKVTGARVVGLGGGRRVVGTGAPGICTGKWWYPGIGDVWQATGCTPRGVLLEVIGQDVPIIVSPPDADAFLGALTTGVDFGIALPAGDAVLLKLVPAGAAVLLAITTAMVIAVFLVGPSRMRYIVKDGRLEVRTLFSRKSWPAGELRARAHSPKVTLRLVGTAFPGYYTGLFRADGANTRMYATDLKRGVLVEGPQRVYVSPAEPEAFLAALRDAGGTIDAASPVS
jgi:Bacterial PH domain